jgi:hypothetical protein
MGELKPLQDCCLLSTAAATPPGSSAIATAIHWLPPGGLAQSA